MVGGYLREEPGKEGQPYRGLRQGGEVYKAKVASLTSEEAGLRAQIKDLTEELVRHKSGLKHTSMARARAEDKEQKAWKDLRVAEDEMRLAKEELQDVRCDLCVKVTTLDGVRQEAWRLEAPWSA